MKRCQPGHLPSRGGTLRARAQVTDPEARYRRYCKDFGKKGYTNPSNGTDWMHQAPQVRVRMPSDRGKEQLGELTVLNERLAGHQAWQARKRVEYLKGKRKAWESVYEVACKHETAMTLNSLETAILEVESALEDGRDEYQSITATKAELVALQEEVERAGQRLRLTRARVDQNVKRLTELKAEAAKIERMNLISAEAMAHAQGSPRAEEARVPHDGQREPYPSSSSPLPEPNPSRQTTNALRRSAEGDGSVNSTSATSLQRSTPSRVSKKSRGLGSTLNLETGLRNFWYAVAFSSTLKEDMLVPVELFGEQWVLFRDETGAVACIYDECAHRACPLSLGTIKGGQVECPYHGWTFNQRGQCVKMPSTVLCRGIQVAHLPAVEQDGFVWVWPGESEPVEVPNNTLPPNNFTLHAEIEVEVPVEHGLLMENLLDLAHAPFTHTSTFAKGWPVPDAVRFHAQRLLSGNWDPYPIDMSFEPPCMVVSMIGLKQPGQIEAGARAAECNNHLHQLHVCLPSRRGHTRLLYRMSLDFMPWIKYVPGISQFWKYIAGQVLGEDLVLVEGQQKRMQQGGDTWGNPVSYDKLAVRYRRWRNGVVSVPQPQQYQAHRMSAGDLFSMDEGDFSPEMDFYIDQR